MCRIDEEHVTLAGLGRIQPGFQFVSEKLLLFCHVFFDAFFGGTGMAAIRCQRKPSFFKNNRVCVGPRVTDESSGTMQTSKTPDDRRREV